MARMDVFFKVSGFLFLGWVPTSHIIIGLGCRGLRTPTFGGVFASLGLKACNTMCAASGSMKKLNSADRDAFPAREVGFRPGDVRSCGADLKTIH